jgi:methionine-rich copper-binding protein CopC
MGSPDGGWYDDDPPKVVGSTPDDQSVNVTSKKITIYFDEFIKLDDASSKVVISPPQMEMAEIKASGKKVVVELQDSLKENTTYSIDFSDAISDNNEGNPMGSYAFTFSTGEHIDTFQVSGYVLDASNLEPVKGIMVGLYDDHADSAFKTKPMLRVSRTDSRGHFVVKGVAPGSYRAYALQDMDNDFRFSQRSEMLAFDHATFSPTSKPDTRIDTIWRDSLHIDALRPVPYTHFLPDDITLLAFTHVQTDRYLLKTERKDAERFSMYFTYGHQDLPVIRGLNFEADSAFVIETNERQDTIHYWLRDTMLVNQDTLRMEVSYMMTDTLGNLVSQTDTLDVLAKTPYEKRMKDKAKEIEKWQKEQEKKKKRDQPYDSIYPVQPLKPDIRIPSAMVPDAKIIVEMPNPLVRHDTAAIHLYSQIDSLWYEAAYVFKPVPGTIRQFEITADWRPATEYSLEIDSAAFENIYGQVSDKYKQGIKVKSLDELGTLTLNLSGVTDTVPLRVQLLNSSGAVTKEVVAAKNVAHFEHILPNKYYVSAYLDVNNNGRWDTGNYDADLQPEDVFFYNREIECKEKWDIKQAWNLTGTPRFKQKPLAITKQKPDAEKKLKNRNADRAKKLGIEYNSDKIVKVDKLK